MRILSIDYGEKRIGLAISDELGIIAKPMPILKVRTLADAISKVQQIARKQNVATILVGLPLNTRGEETKQSIQTRYFADALKSTNTIPIEFWNETFSTKQAKTTKGKTKKTNIDSEAARIIPQEYLDAHSEGSERKMMYSQNHYGLV